MADIKLDGLTVASSSGSPPVVNLDSDVASRIAAKGIAKAWVNFNGTIDASSDTPQDHFTTANNGIRAAHNVDYVIDHGQGDYEVHFENAMANANYVAVKSAVFNEYQNAVFYTGVVSQTASAFRFNTGYTSNFSGTSVQLNTPHIDVAIFGS